MKKSFLLGSFSGIIATLAQSNPFFLQGIPLLTFVSLVPLFIAWASAKTHRDTQTAGLSFALVATLGGSFWLAFFGDFSVFTLGGVVAGYLLFFSVFSFFIWYLFQSPLPFKSLLLAMAWTFYEMIKSSGFLAHPWGLIAHPLHSWTAMIQIVDSIGVFGLGFFVALTNSLIAFWVLRREKTFIKGLMGFTTASFATFFIYGLVALATIPEPDDTFSVLMIQTNEDPWTGSEEVALKASIELSKKGLAEHPETEMVVWSETLLKRFYYSAYYLSTPWAGSVHETLSSYPVQWIMGAPALKRAPVPAKEVPWLKERIESFPLLGQDPSGLSDKELREWWSNYPLSRELWEPTNAILHISPAGQVQGTYSKRQLVPFAENIPFLNFTPVTWFYSQLGITSQWAKGEEVGIFELVTRASKIIKLGLLICFEDAFDLLGRETTRAGADLLVNLTNDAWSKTESAEWQHHIVAKFRTVENRRTMLRSTNGGVTSVTDAWGRELATLPLFEAKSLAYDVPIYRTVTAPFTVLGDWFVSLLSLGFLGIVIVNRKRD